MIVTASRQALCLKPTNQIEDPFQVGWEDSDSREEHRPVRSPSGRMPCIVSFGSNHLENSNEHIRETVIQFSWEKGVQMGLEHFVELLHLRFDEFLLGLFSE